MVDGVLLNNLPSNIVKEMGADYVIGVDVIPRTDEAENFENILEIFDRALDIFIMNQNKEKNKGCNTLIIPVNEKITSLELDQAEKLVKLGEEAAKKAIPKIKRDLGII